MNLPSTVLRYGTDVNALSQFLTRLAERGSIPKRHYGTRLCARLLEAKLKDQLERPLAIQLNRFHQSHFDQVIEHQLNYREWETTPERLAGWFEDIDIVDDFVFRVTQFLASVPLQTEYAVWAVEIKPQYAAIIHCLGDFRIMEWEREHLHNGQYHETIERSGHVSDPECFELSHVGPSSAEIPWDKYGIPLRRREG